MITERVIKTEQKLVAATNTLPVEAGTHQGLNDGPVWVEESGGESILPFMKSPLTCTTGEQLKMFTRCRIGVRTEKRPLLLEAQYLGDTPLGHVFVLNGIQKTSDGYVIHPLTGERMLLPHDPVVTIPDDEIARLNRDRAERRVCIFPDLQEEKGKKRA